MKTQSILVLAMVVMLSDPAGATVFFNDGGHHTIDHTISDSVHVVNGTQVDVVSGGSIGGNLEAFDTSRVTVSGGLVHDDLWAKGYSQITISAGSIGNYFGVRDNSQVTISGGSFGWVFGAMDNSQVNVSGGSFSINFFAEGDSQVNFSGGSILNDLLARENGHVTLSGGNIEGSIYAGTEWWGPSEPNHTSIITIDGIDFAIDGDSIPYGQYFASDYASGYLTGTLASGDLLDNDFYIGGDASIFLVPEPATLLLLGLGAVMLRKTTKNNK